MQAKESFRVDDLDVFIFRTREDSGKAAAEMAAKAILDAVSANGEANVIFAAAPSQKDLLSALKSDKRIPWAKVNAFHLDEYHTLRKGSPQRFDLYLMKNIWDEVHPGRIFPVVPQDGMKVDEIEARYKGLLKEHEPDLALLGVGENGHLAFVDPPYADFEDKATVREVELDLVCRNQQVYDGAYARLEDVPRTAVTMTIPAIMRAKAIITVVPGIRKADAVKAMLEGPVTTACPASVLRRHPNCALFLDTDSSSKLVSNDKGNQPVDNG